MKEMEFLKKKKKTFSQRKHQSRWLHCGVYQTFKEDIAPTLHKHFQKSGEGNPSYIILYCQQYPDKKIKVIRENKTID